jgi:hypothetical protein
MFRRVTTRSVLSLPIAAALGLAALAAWPSAGQTKDIKDVVAEIKAASERFTDVNVALAEGYIRDPHDLCITAEMEGQPAEQGAWASTTSVPTCSGSPPPSRGWMEPEPTPIS